VKVEIEMVKIQAFADQVVIRKEVTIRQVIVQFKLG